MVFDKSNTKNDYGWFVHPFDASQWVYKKVDAQIVGNLFNDNKVNLGVPVSGANLLENGGLRFQKVMSCAYDKLTININVPNEVDAGEAVVYNFGSKLNDEFFVLNQFGLDKQLFEGGGNDDEKVLSHNSFLSSIMDMKNNKIDPNSYIENGEEDNDDDDQ